MAPPTLHKTTADHRPFAPSPLGMTERNTDLNVIHDYLRKSRIAVPIPFLPDVSELTFVPQTNMSNAVPEKLLVAKTDKEEVYAYLTMPVKQDGLEGAKQSKFWTYVVEKVRDAAAPTPANNVEPAAEVLTPAVELVAKVKGPMIAVQVEPLDGSEPRRIKMNKKGITEYDLLYPFNMLNDGLRLKGGTDFNCMTILVKYFFLAKGVIDNAYDTHTGDSFCRNMLVALRRVEDKELQVLSFAGEKGLYRLKGKDVSGPEWSDDESEPEMAPKEDLFATNYRMVIEPYREEEHPAIDAAEPVPAAAALLQPLLPAVVRKAVQTATDPVAAAPGPVSEFISRSPSSSPEPDFSEFPAELMPLPADAHPQLVSRQQQKFAFLSSDEDPNFVKLGEVAKDHIQVTKDIEDRKRKREALKRKRDVLEAQLAEEEEELEMLEMARRERLKRMKFLLEEGEKGGKGDR